MNSCADVIRRRLPDWENFFLSWEKFSAAKILPEETKPVLDCTEFERFAQAFHEPYKRYRKSGAMVNVWRAAGLGNDELRNSQVLGWLLDKFGDHGQGSAILELLIELAGELRPLGVTPGTARDNNYSVRTESLPLGEQESRVDIELEGPGFLIFIEVKVQAPEFGDQLKRYLDIARRKARGRPFVVIYLTPYGRLPASEELRNEIVSISWGQVADILISHVSERAVDSFSGRVIRQFAEHAKSLGT